MTKQQTDSSILYRRNEMGFVHEIECIHHVLLLKNVGDDLTDNNNKKTQHK